MAGFKKTTRIRLV